MATTAIVAEILIVGLEAAAWLTLLVLAAFGSGWVDTKPLEKWQEVTVLVIVAAAYTLGILVDRYADSAHRLLGRLWPTRPVDRPASIPRMRMAVLSAGGGVAQFSEYQRSRQRIARATAMNALVAAPVVAWYVGSKAGGARATAAAAALLGLAVLSEVAYRRIEFAYLCRLGDAYRVVGKKKDRADRAAAVPYRRGSDGVEFLLVTTLGAPKRWTFPKGRRDKDDDTLADAAAREAREEAGVAGKLEGRRLAEYRFPAGNGKEHVVAAFLLEVTREKPEKWRKGDDATRERAWRSRDAALELLKDSDALYHSEMARVIDAAMQELREPDVS